MKKFILLLFLLVFLISGCTNQSNIERGMNYLDSIYENGSYDDKYLLYIYPGESLECPLENCNLTYRLMDAYFNLMFIKKEVGDYQIIDDQVEYADSVFNSILPIWRDNGLYNTIDPNGDFALDTYCILGYIYEDERIADVVENSLIENNWMKDDYYIQDDWRNIADESWCVRLLIKTGREHDDLVRIKVDETYKFIESSSSDSSKLSAVIHTLYVLEDADINNNDSDFFQGYIAKNSEKFIDDNLMQANILEILSKTDYKDKEFLDKIAKRLKERQKNNGAWYLNKDLKENNVQVFTTFRAILALNAYEKN